MALSLASASITFANPLMAPVKWVAESSIVGRDLRDTRNQVAKSLAPLRRAQTKAEQAIARVVMQSTPDVPAKVVGDYNFDPLNLGSPENFAFMREAEIKHGRLAMLAAIAWPTQELFHPVLASFFGKDVLAPNGASPSLLNGGLGQNEIFPALLLFTIGTGLLEETDMSSRKANGCAWNEYPASFGTFGRQPGNFGFDPLNFYRPLNAAEKVQVQERELLNGRVAMLAVAAYVASEFVTGTPIVSQTPALFEPIFMNPSFGQFMDDSFAMAASTPPPGA